MRLFSVTIFLFFLLHSPSHGGEKAYYDYERELVGKTVVALKDLPLRLSPPRGIFLNSGEKITRVSPGDKFQVERVNTYFGVTVTDIWVRIHSADVQGWALFGRDGASGQMNFRVESK